MEHLVEGSAWNRVVEPVGTMPSLCATEKVL